MSTTPSAAGIVSTSPTKNTLRSDGIWRAACAESRREVCDCHLVVGNTLRKSSGRVDVFSGRDVGLHRRTAG